MAQGDLLLRITGMIKDFPGNRALDDVSLDVHSGEIVAVVGHNGSGKSTLVKILAGVYTKDAGEVEFPSSTPEEPTELHIIHQDLGLAMPFNAIENLGIPKDKGFAAGFSPFNKKKEREQALKLINRFGEPFDVTIPVGALAPAQRSIIGIARALDGWHHPRNILILDEPTEALHASEVEVLFEAVKTLAAEGAGIIFISHRLDEVLGLADRVVVLRDGKKVADDPRAAIDHDKLVSYVTGVAAGEAEHGRTDRRVDGPVVLEIENLQGADIEDIDFTLRAGEVVGVAGVLGSGREALPALIFGSLPSQATKFEVAGQAYDKRSPRESIRRGLGFVPGDRAKLGSVRPMTARENVTLPNMKGVTSGGALSKRKERAAVQDLVVKYDVKPPRQEQVFSLFSGGNQQKIVFAKWLRNEPKVLLLEEPTQGVDIGAKQALYNAIDAAAAGGAGVLVCSSEAKELVRLCDRVLVMRGGKVAADLTGEDLTETRIVLEGYGFGNEEEQ